MDRRPKRRKDKISTIHIHYIRKMKDTMFLLLTQTINFKR